MTDRSIDRRQLIGATTALALLPIAIQAEGAGHVPQDFKRFAIWPGQPPGGERVTAIEVESLRTPQSPLDDTAFTHVTTPTITMVRPARPNGGALLLIPGGGYRRVAIGHEGYKIARRFAAAGYCCYILVYRLPADGWTAGPDAPLQDAQRALRLVRGRAARDGFDPAKIGVLGFSAGGHLGARLISTLDTSSYARVDAADDHAMAVRAAGLLYPVVLLEGTAVHAGSRTEMFGASPTPAQLKAYAADARIGPATPPTFLAHALDDRSVPPENSLALLATLCRAGVPSEMHLFENGGHGFGVVTGDASPAPWPDLFMAFARRHGMP